MTFLNPRIDYAFKRLFGSPENKDLLMSLINSIVSDEDQVTDVTILNPYIAGQFQQDKASILDIRARDVSGQLYNIEIQIADEADYDSRALYYWAQSYTSQLKEGDSYKKLCRTIGIHVLNFISILDNDDYHNEFAITNTETHARHFDHFKMHTVELAKFERRAEGDEQKLFSMVKTGLDRWAAFLTKASVLRESLPEALQGPLISKALHVLEVSHLSEEERDFYEGHLKWWRMEESAMEKEREKGLVKGLEQARLEVAKKMLAEGFDKEMIAQLTDLSEKAVESLCGLENVTEPVL